MKEHITYRELITTVPYLFPFFYYHWCTRHHSNAFYVCTASFFDSKYSETKLYILLMIMNKKFYGISCFFTVCKR